MPSHKVLQQFTFISKTVKEETEQTWNRERPRTLTTSNNDEFENTEVISANVTLFL